MLFPLPRRDRRQITNNASYLGVKRLLRNNSTAEVDGHHELIDQIRERLRTDGIPIGKFMKETDTGIYFYEGQWNKNKGVNLHYIVRALDYFGAKLVIDRR